MDGGRFCVFAVEKKKLLYLLNNWYKFYLLTIAASCFGGEVALDALIKAQDSIVTNNMAAVSDFIDKAHKNALQQEKIAQEFIHHATTNPCSLSCNNALLNDLKSNPNPPALLPANLRGSLYIFVSLSMPAVKLIELLQDAKKHQGTLVLRGLKNNSYKETAMFLQKVIQQGENGFIVEPELFQRYQVTRVPQFILVDEVTKTFDKITGNITLLYALQEFRRAGDNNTLAASILSRT
jgi:type-F conjugative transfer system pilin assembly protein TrbC